MPRASLFEIDTVVEDPSNLNSADADLVVTASDTMDYVVKTKRRHPLVPASEWFCHRLAESCGIPTPQFAIIRLKSGETAFGSQWDSSIVTDLHVINSVLTVIPGSPLLSKIFTAILVLDLFVHNEDRHIQNYFFVRTRNSIGVKAFDFSRAFFYHKAFPLPPLPMAQRTHTIRYRRALGVAYPIVDAVVSETVRKVLAVTTSVADSWIGEMPADWIPPGLRADCLRWWDNESKRRALGVERGVKDGTYL